jgi:DNA-binding beta-propeller fold protein YncE
MHATAKKRFHGLLLTSIYILGVFGILASGGSDDDLPPAPKIAGVWSGTWEGIESTLGPVSGTWEAVISQQEGNVSGPINFGGDIDCAEGRMTGTADAETEIVSGDVTRDPCPANNWLFTAFNQDEFIASGTWEKQGLSNGSFEGRRIAKFTGPRIKHVFPAGARPGDYVTIVGEGLMMDPINDSLTLGHDGTMLIPETVSDTVITLRLPGILSEPDHLVLKTSAGEALSPRFFNTDVTTPVIGSQQSIDQANVNLQSAGIAFSMNGRRAFVANRGGGSVSMINVESVQEQVSTVLLPGPTIPVPVHAVAVDPGGRQIYAAASGMIGVLHAHTLALKRTLMVPANGATTANPQGIAVSPDGRWLLVSEAVDAGRVTILDIANNFTVADTLVMAAGNTPRGIATSPDNTRAYIAVSGTDNEIWEYRFASAAVERKIVAGVSPLSVAVTPNGKWLWVINEPATTVNYYDLDTGGGGVVDLGAGVAATGLAITPDGFNVFVANGTSSLRVIDILSKGVTAINVGAASAGVGISPDGKRAYVSLPSLHKIVEIGNQRVLRISKQGGGIGMVTTSQSGIQCGNTCTSSFEAGQRVELRAVADPGSESQFDGWSGDPGCGSEVTITRNLFCVAIFVAAGVASGGDDCFIATAAYGSWLDPHVVTLRQFRDEHLLTNTIGKWFVAFYYRHSPPLADFIRERESLRALVRTVLAAVIFAIEYPLAAGFMLLLPPLVVTRQRRRRVKLAQDRLALR